MHFLNEIVAFFREGFHHVNAVQGLIIALVAAFVMPRWARLPLVALVATAIHMLVDLMLPVMTHQVDFHFPAVLSLPFWRAALVLYLGYVLVIAVFFLLKWIVMGARR